MNYLLDTHAFIWLDNAPLKLSDQAKVICQDLQNTLFLSMASIWEMQIKLQIGKLTLPASLNDTIAQQQKTNRILILPIELKHILGLTLLGDYHRDPFDRLLIAQALTESLIILSQDSIFSDYTTSVIW